MFSHALGNQSKLSVLVCVVGFFFFTTWLDSLNLSLEKKGNLLNKKVTFEWGPRLTQIRPTNTTKIYEPLQIYEAQTKKHSMKSCLAPWCLFRKKRNTLFWFNQKNNGYMFLAVGNFHQKLPPLPCFHPSGKKKNSGFQGPHLGVVCQVIHGKVDTIQISPSDLKRFPLREIRYGGFAQVFLWGKFWGNSNGKLNGQVRVECWEKFVKLGLMIWRCICLMCIV